MTNQQRELDWANKMYTSCNRLNDIYTEIMNYVEGIETMDKQINKVKKDIQTNKKEKAVKDVNKLLKMDKKFDKKLDKCAKMSKKKGKR